MPEKAVGYTLLAVGILVILFSAFSVINVFMGNAEPIQVFEFESIGLSASDLTGGAVPSNQQVDLISADLINETSNLLAHIFLMGFVSTVGFKLASLGTMMVRPIVVKVHEAHAPETPKQA